MTTHEITQAKQRRQAKGILAKRDRTTGIDMSEIRRELEKDPPTPTHEPIMGVAARAAYLKSGPKV